MSTKINEFKSLMTSFARPNLFQVSIQPRNQEANARMNINCYSASIPGLSTATTEKDQHYRSIAYQKIYEDVTLGFYVHEDMREIKYIQDWMSRMIRPQDNHVGFYDDYIGTVEITTIARGGQSRGPHGHVPVRSGDGSVVGRPAHRPYGTADVGGSHIDQWGTNSGTSHSPSMGEHSSYGQRKTLTTTLYDAYPKSIEAIALDYGTNDDIMKFNAVFTYRYYQQEWNKQAPTGQPPMVGPTRPDSGIEDKVKGTGNLKGVHRNESNKDFMARMLGR